MIVIPPLEITTGRLTSSTVSEPDASVSEVAWSAATNYTLGNVVVRTTTHRKYQNTIAGVDATIPESAPTRWLDIGPTNRQAMFDLDRNTQTVVAGTSLVTVITPGVRVGAVGMDGVDAEYVTIDMSVGGIPQYTRTLDLRNRTTTSWSEYFFGVFSFQTNFAVFDIPQLASAVITITLTKASGNIKAGAVILGVPVILGDTQYGLENDVIDFSVVQRDEFGNATLLRRKSVPRITQTVWLTAAGVDKALKLRDDLIAKPAMWCGVEDVDEPYFSAASLVGIFRRFTIQLPGPRHSLCTIELEGL
jgi:hypothetical protein